MNIRCKCCEKAKGLIQAWVDQQGHDRCWYYPEIFEQLAQIFNVHQTLSSNLPSRESFEEGCCRYQTEQYKDKNEG